MERIDFFVHSNGFFSEGVYRPAEIAFAQIGGTEEILLWTVDLSKLKFTCRDRERNFGAHRREHGIIPPHSASRPRFYSVDYFELEYLVKLVFEERNRELRRPKLFAVRGRKQLENLRDLLCDASPESHRVVDVELEYGLTSADVSVVEAVNAPRFHPQFHGKKFRKACAAKIAWTYADFIRDKIRCSSTIENVTMEKESPRIKEKSKNEENCSTEKFIDEWEREE